MPEIAPESAAAPSPYVPVRDFSDFAVLSLAQSEFEDLREKIAGCIELAGNDEYRQCVEIIVRAAAVETGAVELLYETSPGTTMSVALDEEGWREALGSDGEQTLGYVEAQLAVYSGIQDVPDQFTEVWIRELHRSVTEGQATYTVQTQVGAQERSLPRGKYKETPNEVRTRSGGRYLYAPVIDTQPEMAKLVDVVNSQAFRESSPILQSTYVHWAITHIHPFADGNGRVARALASMFLLRGIGIPFLIFADRKFPYFQALEAMDLGDLHGGLAYFENRCFDAMEWLTELLESKLTPMGEQLASDLREVLEQSNTPIESRDDAAVRVTVALQSSLIKAGAVTEEFAGAISMTHGYGSSSLPRGFRSIQDGNVSKEAKESYPFALGITGCFKFAVETNTRVAVRKETNCVVSVAVAAHNRHAVLVGSDAKVPDMHLRLEDISPNLSASAEIRIDTYASKVFSSTLASLVNEARAILLEHGRARFDAGPPEPADTASTTAPEGS